MTSLFGLPGMPEDVATDRRIYLQVYCVQQSGCTESYCEYHKKEDPKDPRSIPSSEAPEPKYVKNKKICNAIINRINYAIHHKVVSTIEKPRD